MKRDFSSGKAKGSYKLAIVAFAALLTPVNQCLRAAPEQKKSPRGELAKGITNPKIPNDKKIQLLNYLVKKGWGIKFSNDEYKAIAKLIPDSDVFLAEAILRFLGTRIKLDSEFAVLLSDCIVKNCRTTASKTKLDSRYVNCLVSILNSWYLQVLDGTSDDEYWKKRSQIEPVASALLEAMRDDQENLILRKLFEKPKLTKEETEAFKAMRIPTNVLDTGYATCLRALSSSAPPWKLKEGIPSLLIAKAIETKDAPFKENILRFLGGPYIPYYIPVEDIKKLAIPLKSNQNGVKLAALKIARTFLHAPDSSPDEAIKQLNELTETTMKNRLLNIINAPEAKQKGYAVAHLFFGGHYDSECASSLKKTLFNPKAPFFLRAQIAYLMAHYPSKHPINKNDLAEEMARKGMKSLSAFVLSHGDNEKISRTAMEEAKGTKSIDTLSDTMLVLQLVNGNGKKLAKTLVEILEANKRNDIRTAVFERLRAITGQDHGADLDAWRKAVEDMPVSGDR